MLLRCLVPCTIQPNQVIVRQGEPPRATYFIIRGLVRMSKPRRPLEPPVTLHDHDFFGAHHAAPRDGRAARLPASGGPACPWQARTRCARRALRARR